MASPELELHSHKLFQNVITKDVHFCSEFVKALLDPKRKPLLGECVEKCAILNIFPPVERCILWW